MDNVVQLCAEAAPTPLQKLLTILSASFITLLLPSCPVTTFNKIISKLDHFPNNLTKYMMLGSFTAYVHCRNIGSRGVGQALALSIKRSHPSFGAEGKPTSDHSFVQIVYRSIIHFNMFHPHNLIKLSVFALTNQIVIKQSLNSA